MSKYFVVSDVHSFFDELMAALTEKGFDVNNPEHKLVLCGDLFDRGPKAIELYNFVRDLDDRFIYVRGNHEDLILDCYQDLISHCFPRFHHKTNGTIDTLSQFTGLTYIQLQCHSPERNKILNEKFKPVLDWIQSKSVNYFEFGKYVCVHGWLPTWSYIDDFRKAEDADWNDARWLNGMELWRSPNLRVCGKTVICGHWHCSWGWSHIRQKRKEFPQKNREDWLKSFEPFVDDGIIAIDACTAYSGIVNCIVLED